MTAFDFDSTEHQAYVKTPSAKSIPSPSGIWIAYENQILAGWQEGRELEGGKEYKVLTNKLDENDEKIGIPGCIYRQPRMLVIGRSPLLYGNDRKVIGVWRKDNGLSKDAYKFARRYMVVFVDADNQPLHIAPIQITSWGVFQVSFDQQLSLFRETCEQVYAKVKKAPHEAKTLLWHSMWVFCPELKTEKRKSRDGQESNACVCIGFESPSVEQWEKHCIGRQAIAQDIATLHGSVSDWWKKGLTDISNISQQQEEPCDVPIDHTRDRNRMLMESQRIVEILGWTPDKGKSFLMEHYGKKSRQLLTDEELINFVGKLQSIKLPDEEEAGIWDEVPY